MMKRTGLLLELLKRSHKIKYTIHKDVFELLNIKEYIEELSKDTDLVITTFRVLDEFKIYVELKGYDE